MRLNDLNNSNIFFVTGKKSFELSGSKAYVEKNISLGKKINCFNNFSSNPKFDDVKKGLNLFRKDSYDCIVAIGGGSVIDMAKLIAFYSERGIEKFDTYLPVTQRIKYPIIAIPTTAGSGSEETHFAVVYNKGIKYSVAHPSLKPTHKILVPELAFNCPNEQKLTSALDAFCQAIESYWSRYANEKSKKYSLIALTLLIENLENGLVKNDFNAFKKIVEASNYAGKAINISKTTACHALSYYFTSKFNVPHGKAVALIMPFIFQYHYINMPDSTIMKRLIQHLDFKSNDYIGEFKKFFKKIGLNDDFQTFGIDVENNIDELVKNVNQERMKNNPINIELNKLFEI